MLVGLAGGNLQSARIGRGTGGDREGATVTAVPPSAAMGIDGGRVAFAAIRALAAKTQRHHGSPRAPGHAGRDLTEVDLDSARGAATATGTAIGRIGVGMAFRPGTPVTSLTQPGDNAKTT
ncbi:MAG: hypothetical protein NHG36_16245 [Chromatiaceae bacterium]|nr:hypothetical protein [Candidatus Thioaporhodococcus sediminis]